ncbi:MAG TPA: beta-propeller fold lactonase family protein [Candidatus Dormibacteraeota bacterium]|nr:beta-propeller fold lactonase family protein [Candidatus Dormibacteraeota bacterium]
MSGRRTATALLMAGALLAACSTAVPSATPSGSDGGVAAASPSASLEPTSTASPSPVPTPTPTPPGGVYSGTVPGVLDPSVANLPARVYVPNETTNDVAVIDPETLTVIGRFPAGLAPEHITPDWDLQTLYVSNMNGASLTVIDPRTERPVETKQVPFPYNLFFTPDGSKAIVVADYLGIDMVADNGLYFYDRETWQLLKFVQVPWPGVNHLDFSPDGSFLIVTCESAGVVVKIDVEKMEILGTVELGGSPLDVRLAPAGDVFFVANQGTHGVDVVDAVAMERVGFIPTGNGAHAFAFSRDVTRLFVTNRHNGTISVISVASRQVIDTWEVGGSPDMATVSPDGSQLWISNRFHGTVTVLNPETGEVIKVIETGGNPHGLTFWPQPGSISLGHNGNMR